MKLKVMFLLLFFIDIVFGESHKTFFDKKELVSTGVYYYPEQWDSVQWERDIKNIANMGFEFTHFAEFAWALLEPKEGVYNFDWLDKAVNIAEKYKIKVIMCTSTATPPVWLIRKHPDILVKNEDGVSLDHGSRQHASFSNNYYRKYSLKMVEKLAQHYGNNNTIIGWQVDNEPRVFYDFGKDAQKRFRNWLKIKYNTIDKMNAVWGTTFWSQWYTDFSQINIPRRSQWFMNQNQILDHNRFIANETATFLDEQASVIRKNVNKSQWITTNYVPNFSDGFIGMSQNLDFITYTKYMVYGEAMGIGSKGYRLGNWEVLPSCNDFFRPLSPHFGVMEIQPGQVNWGNIDSQPAPGAVRLWLWSIFAGGSELICTYRYRSPLLGNEQYHYGVVGYDGITPTPGGTEFIQFMNEVKKLRINYTPDIQLPEDYRKRKTAILFNHENIWGMEQNKQTTEWNSLKHIMKYYKPLKSFGAPVDFIKDDFDFSTYPVLIVPAYQQIDQLLIDKLTNYVKNGGHLIMSCRTGHKNREAHLWEAKFAQPIYNLIGSQIEFYDLLMPHSPDSVSFQNNMYTWTSWGEILSPDKNTETWGTYQNDFYAGKPAIIHRQLEKGTVTYIAVDSKNGDLERDVLKTLYTKLIINIKNYPEGVVVEYRNGFGIAVNYSDKQYEIDLSDNVKIIIGEKIIKTSDVLVWKY